MSEVDLLLTGATLTRSDDQGWTTGTIWFDPDAETGGLVTAGGATQGTSTALPASAPFARAPGFEKVTVTAPPNTGGILAVTALGTLTQGVVGVIEFRLASDATGGVFPTTRLPVTQAFTVLGSLRLERGVTAEVWVEYRYVSGSGASVDAGMLAPSFFPAGVRPGVTGDAWGRYWNGDQWMPPLLQAASMTFATGTTPLPTRTATTTVVTVSPPWVEVDHTVTIKATVGGGGTGSVLFAVSQVSSSGPWSTVGSVPIVAGVATRTWVPELVGNLWVQASYQGDATHLESTGVSPRVGVVEEGADAPPPPPPPTFVARSLSPEGTSQTLAAHTGTAVGQLQIACVTTHQTVVPTTPSGWTLMNNYQSAHNRLTFYWRTLTAGNIASTMPFTWADQGSVEVRTYSNAASFTVVGNGTGLVSTSRVVTGLLVHWVGSSQANTSNNGTKSIAADAALLNADPAHNFTWYGGQAAGDDPTAVGATAPARTGVITGATQYPQWVDVMIAGVA